MKKILFLFLAFGAAISCTDNFEELNTDTKNASTVTGEPLFTNATRDLVDYMQSINVNNNVFRLYSQYWAQTTYPDESQYNMVGRKNPDNWWIRLYRNVLMDYKESSILISAVPDVIDGDAEVKKNKLAIISIMEVYTYSTLVDLFGDVPYTQALNPDNVLPKYDDGQTIYNSIISKLDKAISDLDDSYASFSATSDLTYGGNISKWGKFANSLKLRLALRIADVNPTKASTMALEAAPKSFVSNADNFSLTYYNAPPNTNPIWADLIQSGRNDFVLSHSFVETLNDLQDPRIFVFAKDLVGLKYHTSKTTGSKIDSTFTKGAGYWIQYGDLDGDKETKDPGVLKYMATPFTILASDSAKQPMLYEGGTYGAANSYNAYSKVGGYFENPSLSGTIFSYAEVEFLLAEAIERGIAVNGTAEEHYNAAIGASMTEFGVPATDAAAYLTYEKVAYTTASGDWKEKIGKQKWIAFFNQGLDGWSAWRQFDFSGLTPPPEMKKEDMPTRFIFPIGEATLNGNSRNAAASKYNDDSPTAKVFWDKF